MMIERRQRNRRSGDSGIGRRATDFRPAPSLKFRQASGNRIPERLVVIGSKGLAGAKTARFLKLWAGDHLDVTLIEPGFSECAMAPVGGDGRGDGFAEYFPYDRRGLSRRYGIHVIGAKVASVDMTGRILTLADGTRLAFDRLETVPGV